MARRIGQSMDEERRNLVEGLECLFCDGTNLMTEVAVIRGKCYSVEKAAVIALSLLSRLMEGRAGRRQNNGVQNSEAEYSTSGS